jgi:hypothetical protein
MECQELGGLTIAGRGPNAGHQARRTAGARHERTLFAVAWMPLIMIEASSSAYHCGSLALGTATN